MSGRGGSIGRVGVVFNANTRRHRRDPSGLEDVRRAVGDGFVRVTRTREDIAAAAREFAAEGVDILGIVGGDGTNHITLGTFSREYGTHPFPRVLLLPGGTMNTAALSVGMTRAKPAAQLATVVAARAAHRPLRTTRRHLLHVGNDVGFMFGTGIVAGYLREYYDAGPPSPMSAARTLGRAIFSTLRGGAMAKRMLPPFHAAVVVDGRDRWEARRYLTIVAATIDQMGLGFRPFPRFDEQPGRFQMLAIVASPAALISELPALRLGRPMGEAHARDLLAENVTIESPEPFHYTVDGELLQSDGRLALSVGPLLEIVIGPDGTS